MNNELQQQIKEQLEQLENNLNNLKDLLSSSINQSEQERIIKKNRIISRLEIENEKLKTKLSDALKRD